MACVRWWLGGNCYHRRRVAACRRRVGGLWSQNPPRGCSVARLRPRVVAWVCCGVWWYVSGVVVAWVVFVGGLGGIATIGAALRRVVGVSVVYGRKTPRVLGWKGQRRVPVEGSMVVNLPCGCSKCSPSRWNGGDMGCLGCSGLRFGRAGSS